MKIIFYSIFLLLFSIVAQAQTPSYNLDELSFSSDREKNTFEQYLEDSTLFLPLLVEMGGNEDPQLLSEVEHQMNSIYVKLEGMKVRDKKPKKQIQILYKEVHNQLFKKYIAVIPFYKAFTVGEYNCATATAIYSMVLTHFDIPFQIKEKPNHVYIVAYPGEYDFLIETTSPSNQGAIAMNDKMKSNIVDALVKDKLVSKSEVQSKGVNKVFYEYFFADTNIDLRKLISWLYSNEGYSYLIDEKYKASLEQIKKADYISSNEIFKEVIVNLNVELLRELQKTELEYAEKVVEISRFIDYNNHLSADLFVGEHQVFINEMLVHKNNKDSYLEVYEVFKTINDSSISARVSYDHFESMARYYLNNEMFGKALGNAIEASHFMPENKDLMNLIDLSIIKECQRKYRGDIEGRIEYINSKVNEFPELKDRSKLQLLLMEAHLEIAFNAILKQKDIATAKMNIESFEKMFDPDVHYEIDQRNVVIVYEHLGMYYFKKNQITNARKSFKKGLSYFPNAYSLEEKLKYL